VSTALRILYIAFWMLPVQRACTVLGLGVMVGIGGTLYSPAPLAGSLIRWGYFVALAPPALMGGAFWRALSAQRVVDLAPRGRLAMLMGVLLAALMLLLSLVASGALYALGAPGFAPPTLSAVLHEVFTALAVLTPWVVSWLVVSFVVSRSPLSMLLVLVTGTIGAYFAWRFDLLTWRPDRFVLRPWHITVGTCLLFACWYLLARRVRPPAWLLPGGQSLLATVAMAGKEAGVIDKHAALERLLLGGVNVARLLAQWLLVFSALLVLMMLMAQQGEEEARIVAHLLFAALVLFPAIVSVQAVAIVRRARALWLPSGFSRGELLWFTARTLGRFALGMVLLSSGLMLLLWNTQPWRPSLPLAQLLLLPALPGFLAVASALLRPAGQLFYWPAVVLAMWLLAWHPLTVSDPAAWSSVTGWLWGAPAAAAIILMLAMAPRRWLEEDFPRLTSSPAS
jgi:hypothetical protein